MKERELLELWVKYRNQLIFAQLAPTFLLITSVSLIPSIKAAGDYAVYATIGILLASGILGALAEYFAAHEAQAVARDLAKLDKQSRVSRSIVKNSMWLHVAKYVTPSIFIAIFVFLVLTLI